jgi:hypothetical protein
VLGTWQSLTFLKDNYFGATQPYRETLPTLFAPLLLMIVYVIIACCSPMNIVSTQFEYFVLVTFGLLFSKTTLHIQIAHLTKEKYN